MDSLSSPTFRINFLFAWYATALVTFLFSSFFLTFISIDRQINIKPVSYQLYAALPESQFITTEAIAHQDARAEIIKAFFEGYNAPLAQYSEAFVKSSDKYELDYRLLPAIAMQESSGGKKVITDSHNPFGYGIYGDKVTKFASWEECIEQVAKTLKEKYINQGLITPYQIMTKYTPPSLEKGGPWAINVMTFMEGLK